MLVRSLYYRNIVPGFAIEVCGGNPKGNVLHISASTCWNRKPLQQGKRLIKILKRASCTKHVITIAQTISVVAAPRCHCWGEHRQMCAPSRHKGFTARRFRQQVILIWGLKTTILWYGPLHKAPPIHEKPHGEHMVEPMPSTSDLVKVTLGWQWFCTAYRISILTRDYRAESTK